MEQSFLAGGRIDEEMRRTKLRKKYKVMSIVLIVIIFVATAALVLSYDKCKLKGHTWSSATCIDPQICTLCNTTEGSPLGYDWLEATCTEAETCIICGEICGFAIGHTWKAATFLNPKTGIRCGNTEGTQISSASIDVENEIGKSVLPIST